MNSEIETNSCDEMNLLTKYNQLYLTEFARKKSFDLWEKTKNFDVDKAVKLGLYHVKHATYNDYVVCVFCEHTMSNWTETETVEEKHRNISPDCVPKKSIPLKYKILSEFMINNALLHYYDASNKVKNTNALPDMLTRRIEFDVEDLWLEYNQFVEESNLPKPDYMNIELMLETFESFYNSDAM